MHEVERYKNLVKNYTESNIIESFHMDALIVFKHLRKQGKSWKWIYLALQERPIAQWNKYKFSLLYNSSYCNRITKQYNALKALDNGDLSLYEVLVETLGDNCDTLNIYDYILEAQWNNIMISRFISNVSELNKSAEWISIALSAQPSIKWEEYGFGLMFYKNFEKTMEKRLKRYEKVKSLEDEFNSIDEESTVVPWDE